MTSRSPDMEHSDQCQLTGLLRHTKGKKKPISSCTWESVPSICLWHEENQPNATLARPPSQLRWMRGQRLQQGPQGWEGNAWSCTPTPSQEIAIGLAETFILLSKHIWRFLSSVVWLTAPVWRGLVLCTLCVKTQPAHCPSGRSLLEWEASDVGTEEDRNKHKCPMGKVSPQESQNLIWPAGSGWGCPSYSIQGHRPRPWASNQQHTGIYIYISMKYVNIVFRYWKPSK